MKKTLELQKLFVFFVVGCLFLFNLSCGLDVYEVIPAPTSVIHPLDYENEDPAEKYFNFWTNEKFQLSNFTFLGTDVYYKIYNNYSTMLSDRATLQSLADSTTSTNSASTMRQSLSYQPLLYKGETSAVLIPAESANRQVYIRLSNYQDEPAYSARIFIGDKDNEAEAKAVGVPVRNTGGGTVCTFDFGRTGDNDLEPVNGDIDVKASSTASEEGKWYVQLFAVGVARDNSFSTEYSNVLYIGAVTIDANQEDN